MCFRVTFFIACKKKVNYTPVQALRHRTGRTGRRRSRGIALPSHYLGTRRGEGSASRPGRSLPPGKIKYPLYRGLGGPQDRSGQVRKISSPTGIRSPDRPARSQSLYRLRYPAHPRQLGVGVNVTPWPLYLPERTSAPILRGDGCSPVPIVQEAI